MSSEPSLYTRVTTLEAHMRKAFGDDAAEPLIQELHEIAMHVRREMDLLDHAVTLATAVKKAWMVEGPVPNYHRHMQERLRQEWTTLGEALDRMCLLYG